MSSHNSVILSPDTGRPVARLTNLQLASKMAWHTRRALNATGANKALYDARARLALRYWLRAHGHVLGAL